MDTDILLSTSATEHDPPEKLETMLDPSRKKTPGWLSENYPEELVKMEFDGRWQWMGIRDAMSRQALGGKYAMPADTKYPSSFSWIGRAGAACGQAPRPLTPHSLVHWSIHWSIHWSTNWSTHWSIGLFIGPFFGPLVHSLVHSHPILKPP